MFFPILIVIEKFFVTASVFLIFFKNLVAYVSILPKNFSA